MNEPDNRSRRSAFRFSLRSLLLVTLLTGFFLGAYLPLAAKLRQSQVKNRQLQAQVNELNAKVRDLETSAHVNTAAYINHLEAARNQIDTLSEALRGRGYAGRGTYFLQPPRSQRD